MPFAFLRDLWKKLFHGTAVVSLRKRVPLGKLSETQIFPFKIQGEFGSKFQITGRFSRAFAMYRAMSGPCSLADTKK